MKKLLVALCTLFVLLSGCQTKQNTNSNGIYLYLKTEGVYSVGCKTEKEAWNMSHADGSMLERNQYISLLDGENKIQDSLTLEITIYDQNQEVISTNSYSYSKDTRMELIVDEHNMINCEKCI